MRGACQEMITGALSFCEHKTPLRGRETIIAAFRRGDRAVGEYFHYGLAKEIGSYLGRVEPTLKAVYLYEPEEMPDEFYEQGPSPIRGLDLIAWVVNGKGGLTSIVRDLEAALAAEAQPLFGPPQEGMRDLLSVDVIDDRDVELRLGRGALITSIYTRPTRVWSRYVIRLNPEYCGRCRICANVCPFDAITLSAEASAAKIDVEKCQLCGLCYSACPSGAIEASYYDLSSLVQDVRSSVRAHGFKSIALTCRGSTPTAGEIQELIGVEGCTPICLPCVGRIPSEFFLKAISLGIERIAVIPCADGHCRFEDGNRNIRNRLLLLQPLLQALNYDRGLVTLHQVKGPTATVDPELCSGCGTCLAVCPYQAIAKSHAAGGVLFVAEIDPSLCQGCGACVSNCPSRAIALSRFGDTQVLGQIQAALSDAGRPKNGSRVLGFRCHWCSYGDADLPFDRRQSGHDADVIRVPCVGRIDPLHIVWAFLNGADGVFLGACPPDNCRYGGGSEREAVRVTDLVGLLDSHGFDSRRLRLEWIKRDTPDAFDNSLRAFATQVSRLGALDGVSAPHPSDN